MRYTCINVRFFFFFSFFYELFLRDTVLFGTAIHKARARVCVCVFKRRDLQLTTRISKDKVINYSSYCSIIVFRVKFVCFFFFLLLTV